MIYIQKKNKIGLVNLFKKNDQTKKQTMNETYLKSFKQPLYNLPDGAEFLVVIFIVILPDGASSCCSRFTRWCSFWWIRIL